MLPLIVWRDKLPYKLPISVVGGMKLLVVSEWWRAISFEDEFFKVWLCEAYGREEFRPADCSTGFGALSTDPGGEAVDQAK